MQHIQNLPPPFSKLTFWTEGRDVTSSSSVVLLGWSVICCGSAPLNEHTFLFDCQFIKMKTFSSQRQEQCPEYFWMTKRVCAGSLNLCELYSVGSRLIIVLLNMESLFLMLSGKQARKKLDSPLRRIWADYSDEPDFALADYIPHSEGGVAWWGRTESWLVNGERCEV